MSTPKGFVLYRGPSMLDGSPIAMVATLKTNNRKTGDMIQTWIIRTDLTPVEASKRKLDNAICGNCPQRWSVGGACYVNIGQAPQAVYKGLERGIYPDYDATQHSKYFTGRMLRLGAYGDPAAVPIDVVRPLLSIVKGHTGYTHQMRHKGFDKAWLEFLMVSADTPRAAMKARESGARYFRVSRDGEVMQGEIECLSESKGISCADCGLCNGKGAADSIVITVHGTRASNFLNNNIIARG